MDPQISQDIVPSYKVVEEKIRQIDNTIIIVRTYYIVDNHNFAYRFQLVRKDKMCMIDIPGKLLNDLKNNIAGSDEELMNILEMRLQSSECWSKFEK